jgi:chromosomal replication initiator protein
MRRLKSAARRLERACSPGARLCDLGPEELDALLCDLYTPRPNVRPEEIVQTVAAAFRIDPAALTGPARDQKYALPRHLAAWLCVERLGLNLKETAAVIGRKDHASVIHARRKISELLGRDLFFQNQVREISDRLFRARG